MYLRSLFSVQVLLVYGKASSSCLHDGRALGAVAAGFKREAKRTTRGSCQLHLHVQQSVLSISSPFGKQDRVVQCTLQDMTDTSQRVGQVHKYQGFHSR